MNRIKVTICAGTTCYLMGAAYLQSLCDHLDASIREFVDIDGARCLGMCKDSSNGEAPFVLVNGEIISGATMHSVIERIELIVKGDGR